MGPDNGTCNDLNYPVMIPWIFMEVYVPLSFVCCVIKTFTGVLGHAEFPRPAKPGYDTPAAFCVRIP